MPTRFEYTDASGDKLVALPARNGILVEAENAPHVPLDRVEEVVAGIRDMARQAGGVTAAPRRRLTELEHDAAWHAIDGLDWAAYPDADTVLNAVLHALGIDPPGALWTPCTPAWLATQSADACNTTPRRDGRDGVSHYHLTAEGAGA